MKFLDENGRLFGRISIVDVLAILVVVFAAVAMFTSQTRTAAPEEEEFITFQIEVRGVDAYLTDAVLVGDSLYDDGYSSGGRGIGEITDVQVVRDPGTQLSAALMDGTLSYLEAEDTVDLLITVKGRGTRNDRNYTLNRVYALGLNANRVFYTKQVKFTGRVCEIFE